ncbi:hypothetical protein CBFG_04477 [Clostridiales bacterium 1_7_47FAA]|nr:hypothetical protein CBFG_04477 [Clostridiales bacterium 1_7_47FAA]
MECAFLMCPSSYISIQTWMQPKLLTAVISMLGNGTGIIFWFNPISESTASKTLPRN